MLRSRDEKQRKLARRNRHAHRLNMHHYLTPADDALIAGEWSAYVEAAKTVGGLPPNALAAYRIFQNLRVAAGYVSQVGDGRGGEFACFQGGIEEEERIRRIQGYVKNVCERYDRPAADLAHNLDCACLVAAHEIRDRCTRGAPLRANGEIDREGLAYGYWGLLGRSPDHCERWQSGVQEGNTETSWMWAPLVWNDPLNDRVLYWQGLTGDGKFLARHPCKVPGVMILYEELEAREELNPCRV